MTIEELEFLKSVAARAALEKYIDTEPSRVAMLARKEFGAFASTLATQVKYLGRAKTKIPLYYENRCVIEPLAFEQSSSAAVSHFKDYGGKLCLDLTCGLGIDVVNFASHFERVITVERNPLLVEIVRYNFSLLGIENVEVVEGSSEAFVASRAAAVRKGEASVADLLYADPARRDSVGKKTVGFASCSPDIVPMLAEIETCAKRVVVKCSPLFEVSELFAVFGTRGVGAEVISSRGECKEVVVDKIFGSDSEPQIIVRSDQYGSRVFEAQAEATTPREFAPPYKYLLVPDVAIYKARLAERYVTSEGEDAFIDSQNGYGFANTCPEEFFGRIFEIESMEPLKPRKIKKDLATRGIKKATIMQHNSSLSNESLAKSLGIKFGGSDLIAACDIKRESYIVFIAKKV